MLLFLLFAGSSCFCLKQLILIRWFIVKIKRINLLSSMQKKNLALFDFLQQFSRPGTQIQRPPAGKQEVSSPKGQSMKRKDRGESQRYLFATTE